MNKLEWMWECFSLSLSLSRGSPPHTLFHPTHAHTDSSVARLRHLWLPSTSLKVFYFSESILLFFICPLFKMQNSHNGEFMHCPFKGGKPWATRYVYCSLICVADGRQKCKGKKKIATTTRTMSHSNSWERNGKFQVQLLCMRAQIR